VEASPLFRWLWSSSNLGKHKFFSSYLWEIDLIQGIFLEGRTEILMTSAMSFCNSGSEETLEHLFFTCSFS
jgi:hypothetical protein